MWSQPISCINLFRYLLLAVLMLSSHWVAADSAETALMPGKVIQNHAKYEDTCTNCHKRFDKGAQTGLCLDCHKETAKDVRSKKGYHGRLKDEDKECRTCHTDHKGRDAKIVIFDKKSFKHDETGFSLEDKHKETKCEDCHKPKLKYRETPSKCEACHKKDDVHKGKLGPECGDCHNAKDWKKSTFDHEKIKFKLAGGKHEDVKCDKCHFDKALKLDKTFKLASKECDSCHHKDDQAKNGHKGRYGTKCETCHTDRGWKELRFNHDKQTNYVLRDKHLKVKCDSCHSPKKPLYKQKLSTTCVSCHLNDDKKKGHQGKLGKKCESCHNEKGWETDNFDHDKNTDYPLKGKHRDAKCKTCHKDGLAGAANKKALEKLDTKCVSCHLKKDVHKNKLGSKCETCHDEKSWTETRFDHQFMSKYPLLGRHALVTCNKCHLDQTYKGASNECYDCHEKDDTHKRRLGTECKTCHTTRSWQTWDFDHSKTKFKLDGPHKKGANKCTACHFKQMDKEVLQSTACGSCHDREDVHNGSFGDRCERCHDGNDWKKVKIGSTPLRKLN